MNELSLFTGVGGGLLGTHLLGFRPVCAVEIDPYCQRVLLQRQRDGVLPLFPIWGDIRDFDGRPWRGVVDVVSAGFPCQPFSVAGKQQREDDERNMWPDTIRVLREVRPRWALLENVGGLVRCDYFGEILADLAAAGFDAEWDVVSAGEVGAPHLRERLWVLCHANGQGESVEPLDAEASGVQGDIPDTHSERRGKEQVRELRSKDPSQPRNDGEKESLANTSCSRLEGQRDRASSVSEEEPRFSGSCWWETEPSVGRVADGVAHRVDRLRAIGNGQVSSVVREAWHRLRQRYDPIQDE